MVVTILKYIQTEMTVKVFAAHVYWNYLGLFVSVMDVCITTLLHC